MQLDSSKRYGGAVESLVSTLLNGYNPGYKPGDKHNRLFQLVLKRAEWFYECRMEHVAMVAGWREKPIQ